MPEFNFSYKDCIREIDMLTSKYPFVSTGSIGNSVLGKSIPYIRLGIGPKKFFSLVHIMLVNGLLLQYFLNLLITSVKHILKVPAYILITI